MTCLAFVKPKLVVSLCVRERGWIGFSFIFTHWPFWWWMRTRTLFITLFRLVSGACCAWVVLFACGCMARLRRRHRQTSGECTPKINEWIFLLLAVSFLPKRPKRLKLPLSTNTTRISFWFMSRSKASDVILCRFHCRCGVHHSIVFWI